MVTTRTLDKQKIISQWICEVIYGDHPMKVPVLLASSISTRPKAVYNYTKLQYKEHSWLEQKGKHFNTVIYCAGSSILDEPRITSLLSLPVSLWQVLSWWLNNTSDQKSWKEKEWKQFFYQSTIQTSDLVAPPTMNINIRCPIFLKSLDACLKTGSL